MQGHFAAERYSLSSIVVQAQAGALLIDALMVRRRTPSPAPTVLALVSVCSVVGCAVVSVGCGCCVPQGDGRHGHVAIAQAWDRSDGSIYPYCPCCSGWTWFERRLQRPLISHLESLSGSTLGACNPRPALMLGMTIAMMNGKATHTCLKRLR